MSTLKIFKIATLFLAFTSIIACNANKRESKKPASDSIQIAKDTIPFVLKHLDVDKKKIMPYVTGSEQMVDSLLVIADTVYSYTDHYKLEDLDMENKDYNEQLEGYYGDTIPTVAALFDSYARITNSGMDEADASFVWHEVARMQMKHFFERSGNKWQETKDCEIIFRIIDGMVGSYSCGNQPEINVAAWRAVMPIDYRLVDAYKRLADLCNDKEIVKLIHDDYMYTLNVYKEHRDGIEGHYSDLPRVEGELFKWVLKTKLETINTLIKRHKRGQMGLNAVKQNLREHLLIAELNKEFLDRKGDDFQ